MVKFNFRANNKATIIVTITVISMGIINNFNFIYLQITRAIIRIVNFDYLYQMEIIL